jgi:hypothetical protein
MRWMENAHFRGSASIWRLWGQGGRENSLKNLVLERSCVACHSGEKPKGGFAIADRAALLKGGNRGEPVVVPGQSDAGTFMHLVEDQVEDLEMPPVAKRAHYPAMTKDETARLRTWIDQGAVWPKGVILRVSGN